MAADINSSARWRCRPDRKRRRFPTKNVVRFVSKLDGIWGYWCGLGWTRCVLQLFVIPEMIKKDARLPDRLYCPGNPRVGRLILSLGNKAPLVNSLGALTFLGFVMNTRGDGREGVCLLHWDFLSSRFEW